MTFDCPDPVLVAEFWSAALGYETIRWDDYDGATSLPTDGSRPHLGFIKVPEGKTVKNWLHLDIEPSETTMEFEVERLILLGATKIKVFNEPSGTWTLMADPEGNEFCVAQPDSV
jgi:predicted enzyme related to lactoylglutathione lyase